MNEIFDSNLETQVIESRKEALKNREKRKKGKNENEIATANNIVNLVLNIFKASDNSEQGKLVWHVHLITGPNEKKDLKNIYCYVGFMESIIILHGAYDKDDILYSEQYKEVLGAIENVNAIKITEDVFNKAIDYFKSMTNFKVAEFASDSGIAVTITLKSDNL